MTDREFFSFYAAHFGPINESDGIAYWREFVAASDTALLADAVEALAATERRGRPRLGDLKRAYHAARKARDVASLAGRPDAENCAYCDDTGWASVVWAGSDYWDKKIIARDRPVRDWGEVREDEVPCRCARGRRLAAKFDFLHSKDGGEPTPPHVWNIIRRDCIRHHRDAGRYVEDCKARAAGNPDTPAPASAEMVKWGTSAKTGPGAAVIAAEHDHGPGRIQGRAETNAVRSDL